MGRAACKWCLLLLAAGLLVLPLRAAAGGPPGSVIAWGCHRDGKTVECNVPAAAATGVKAIAAGLVHGLALKLDGSVIAWGCFAADDWGQCTVPVAAASGVTAISAGMFHSLAVKNGGVIAWGCKGESLGDPPTSDSARCRPRPEAASLPSRPARATASR
jgi:alpha-tubulin suppressor-like RCC1 family protein